MRRTRRTLQSRVLSSTPSPTGGTKGIAPPMWSKRRQMARWLLTRLGSKKGVGITPFGCPRMSSPIWRGLKWCGFQRRLKAKEDFGGFGDLAYKLKWRFTPKQAKLTTWTFVAQVPHKVMVARFQFKYHVAPLLLLGCLHALHLLVYIWWVACVMILTHEQST